MITALQTVAMLCALHTSGNGYYHDLPKEQRECQNYFAECLEKNKIGYDMALLKCIKERK